MRSLERSVYVYNEIFDILNKKIVIDNANTEKDKIRTYSLRYQIFSVETNIIKAENCIQYKECDEYDSRSICCSMIYTPTDTILGHVRIITSDQRNIERSFPIQKVCNHSIFSDRKLFIRRSAVEISRFGFSHQGKNAVKNHLYENSFCNQLPDSVSIDDILSTIFYIKLQQAVVKTCIEYGFDFLLSYTRPHLLRKLTYYGIYFRPIGPVVLEERYSFQPCYIHLDEMLSRMAKDNPIFYKYVIDGIKYEKYCNLMNDYIIAR